MKSLISLTLVFVTLSLISQENSEHFETLFYGYGNDSQRLELVQKQPDGADSLAPFADRALLTISREGIPSTDNHLRDRIELQKMLLRHLKPEVSQEVESFLLDLYANNRDPFLRAEIYMAWGRINSEPGFERILSRVLELTNSNSKDYSEEVEAFGVVSSLALYTREISTPHLVLLHRGWFSSPSNVRSKALEVLDNMSPRGYQELTDAALQWDQLDQAEQMIEVGFRVYPQESWLGFALAAFENAFDRRFTGREAARIQSRLLDLSLAKVLEIEMSSQELFPYLEKVTEDPSDLVRMLNSLKALSFNEDTASIGLLIRLLTKYNQQAIASGISRDEESIVLAILSAMEARNDPSFSPVIGQMRHSRYRSTILRESQRVLSTLP